MGGAAEDGAGAVFHQHEVGDIDRQAGVGTEGVDGQERRLVAHLLGGLDHLLAGADAAALGDELGEIGVGRGEAGGERMVGRDGDEARAEESVVAGGEDLDGVAGNGGGAIGEGEADAHALRPADPVLLHQADFFRPAVEGVDRGQQVLGVAGDPQEPLGQLALLHLGAGAPAAPVDHLLVGEHGLVDRVPVDLRLAAVGEVFGEEIEEELLLLGVVFRIAGGEFPRPVERQAHHLELVAHDGDVVVGPRARVDPALHGRVLGRQAEGVPAHGMEDVVALGAHGAGNDVAHGVVADVAHVDAPRRVGEHLQDVVFRAGIVVRGFEDAGIRPRLAPARFRLAGIVSVGGHCGRTITRIAGRRSTG